MIHTVRVTEISEKEDLRGKNILNELKTNGISNVRSVKVYRLEGIDRKRAKFLAEKLLAESISQNYSIDKPVFNNLAKSVEVAYKPGVMNPEVASIIKAGKDLGIKLLAADSSWEYNFFGKIDKKKAEDIIKSLRLYNPLIF